MKPEPCPMADRRTVAGFVGDRLESTPASFLLVANPRNRYPKRVVTMSIAVRLSFRVVIAGLMLWRSGGRACTTSRAPRRARATRNIILDVSPRRGQCNRPAKDLSSVSPSPSPSPPPSPFNHPLPTRPSKHFHSSSVHRFLADFQSIFRLRNRPHR